MSVFRTFPKWLYALLLAAFIGGGFVAYQQGWLPAPDTLISSEKKSAPLFEQFTLSNGLEVIFIPNHRVPAVSHMIIVKAGGADDPQGKSGLAHYLEHLMFKGTKKVPDGEYSKRIEALGGQFNAFTSTDMTGYYVNIAKEHLPVVMELEADRMQSLLPPLEAFKPERDVIIEERVSRTDNQPMALLDEQIAATLYQHHPYRIPIIGWLHEMKTLTAEDAKAFYDRHYYAANMVLVVAGDMTRDEIETLANRYYGGMKKRELAPRNWTQEPPHRAAKRIAMSHPQVQQTRWRRVYLAPSLVSGQVRRAIPLELLAQWLGGGVTGQLYRELVIEQKLATAASASYSSLSRGPAEFTIAVTPAAGISQQQVELAVNAVLHRARTTLMSKPDMERVKTLLKAQAVYAQDGLQQIAYYVAYLRALDLPLDYYTQWSDKVDAVMASQIRSAARAVFRPEQSVTATLKPKVTHTKEQPDAR